MPLLRLIRHSWLILSLAIILVPFSTPPLTVDVGPSSSPPSERSLSSGWAAPATRLPAYETPSGEGPWVVRAYFTARRMVDDLAAWREPWEVHHDEGYLILDVTREEYERLLNAGFRVEVDEQLTAQLNQPRVRSPGQLNGIPGYACYRTVEETFAAAEVLVDTYPQLATWIDIGNSWEKTQPGGNPGYDLLVLRLTNSAVPGPKPKLYVMSAIHAREYATAELNTRFAEYLANNYGSDPDVTWLLDYHEIHLLLQVNPDGRKKAEAAALWRKNTNDNYCTDPDKQGADLNRNFAFQWACCGGSSGSECNPLYRGPGAASEPETQFVQSYVRAQFPDQRAEDLSASAPVTSTGVFLDVHSYGEQVLWPWGFGSAAPPNETAFKTLGRKFAFFNNYAPEQASDLYLADGTAQDFAYGELGVAAFSFELGTAFFQDCATFENDILPDNLPALLYAAKVARTPYLTPAGPDALNLSVAPAIVMPGQSVSLTATVDDTRYNNSNGTEPTQNIAAAEYYIDVPPWDTGASPAAHAMAAADGAFNKKTEGVEATINTTGLSEGRHTIFVHGRDAADNWGPFSAVFLDVALPPTAAFSSNSPVPVGHPAIFTDQTDGTPPLTYDWDFGDSVGSSSAANPSYTYATTGTFNVTLDVTNSIGSDSITHPVQVCTPAEIVSLTSDSPVTLRETMHFSATASGPGPVTYTWDFGDGTPLQSGANLRNVAHTYTAPKAYNVTLEVENACPLADRSTLPVQVDDLEWLFAPLVTR